MVFEPWICRETLTGGGVGVASIVGASVGVGGGVIAATGEGLSRNGAGDVSGPAGATALGLGFNRYQAPPPIPQRTKRAKIRRMGRIEGLMTAVSGARHSGHTNSAPSGI